MLIKPTIFNKPIVAAQSTRLGGVSSGAFNSLNLGKSTNDDPSNIQTNRTLFFGQLDIPLNQIALSKQVHGNQVLLVEQPGVEEGYDALITNRENIFVAVSIADCLPVLIYDERNHAVAAIHAGWRGTVGQITTATLHQMNKVFGTNGSDCKAYIGACIGANAFEVGPEVAFQFDDSFKKKGKNNKYFVDIKAANFKELLAAGVHTSNIEISPYCTVEHNHLFFSHRKENGITGRMMAVIGMKAV